MKNPDVNEQPESANAGCVQRVVSLRFGELKHSGCNTHPHRLDLSCAKIRRVNGAPLTNADVWEVLKELSDMARPSKLKLNPPLRGGTELTPEQCKDALDSALLIIAKVGTTGIEHAHQEAERWMQRYYPAWV